MKTQLKIKHRIPQREKYANNAQWGKDYLDYIIPRTSGLRSLLEFRREAESNYKLYNNEIDQDDFAQWCKPLGIDVSQHEEFVLPFNKTYQKINVLLGEQANRGDIFRPILLSEKDIQDKTFEQRELLKAWVKSRQDLLIAKNTDLLDPESDESPEQQLGLEQVLTPEKILSTKFLSQKEIFAGKVLDFAKYDQDIKYKSNEGFKHGLISDFEAFYVGYEHGKPAIKLLNPLTVFFEKDNETEFIQDGDWAGTRWYDTTFNILRDYGHKMSKEDRMKFDNNRSMYRGTRINKDGDIGLFDSLDWNQTKELSYRENEGTIGNNVTNSEWSKSDMIEVVHAEWKTLRKVIVLRSYNEYGEPIIDIVDETFPIPKTAQKVEVINEYGDETTRKEWIDVITGKKYSAEELYVTRKWEGTRIDGDIYVDVREVPNQPLNIDRPHDCKLSYYGLVYNATNAKSISMLSRMRPFQMLYFVAMHQLSKLLARNNGRVTKIDFAQIPNFKDKYGREDTELFLWYLSKGLAIYDSDKGSQGGPISHRSNGVDSADVSTTVDMLNLTQLCMWLDLQISEAAGISKPREGQMSPNTNVTDNQQSILQSAHITEIYFQKHNMLWKYILQAYLNLFVDWAKRWFEANPGRKEHVLQYITQDEGIQMLRVTPEMLDESDFGIFVEISSAGRQYMDKMEQFLLPMIQNEMQNVEMVSDILKARAQGMSPEELHKKIVELTGKMSREQQEQLENERKMQEEFNQQRQAIQNEQLLQVQALEKEKILLKEELDRLKQLEVTYAKADAENSIERQSLEMEKQKLEQKEQEVQNQLKTLKNN